MKPEKFNYKSVIADCLELLHMIDWTEKPSTMNQLLTVNQLQHRGYSERVTPFLEMQEIETIMVEN